ncbi:MAG TPA: sensor histidine kinase [Candidatus Binatia bacterium]|nr:sensor histidine kinase [Candidatus Binatia bacterium]
MHGFGLGDIAARVAGALTAAIDSEHAEAASAHDAGSIALPIESRLRIATFFALACGVLFLPVDGSRVPSQVLTSLLLLYVAHAALTSVVLIASFTARGERHADALAVGLVVGHAVNLLVYLTVWPRHPGLAAGILACLLMANTVLFGWTMGRVLILATLFCVGFLTVGTLSVPRGIERTELFVAAIVLTVGAVTAVGCARLLAMLRASLAARQRELTDLSARLMAVQEDERRRLSRDLHDEFGQSLTAVNAYLWLIERQTPEGEPEQRGRVAEARRLVNRTLGAMRELSQLLRPAVLDTLGLVPSLDALVKSFAASHGIAASLTADELPGRLSATMETALYRVAQEALTNVARHARARHVRVALAALGDELRLEVEDDGVGFPPNGQTATGTGLVGIRERVRSLGGQLTVTSRRGVRLSVQVPLAA